MFQYAAQCLTLAPIFIATVSGFWSCVDDLSSNPERLTCSAIASEKILFYMSPILPIRMSITITSNSITLNHTKGFNWRTINSSSQIEHCESVEAITSLGASKLSFICLFGTYQDGSYPMKVKLAPKITVNLKMIVEAETTRKDRISNSSINSFLPNREELSSPSKRLLHSQPHLTTWKHMETSSNISVRSRVCSHILCPANVIVDVVVTSEIPPKVQKMEDEAKKKKMSKKLLEIPTVRLSTVSSSDYNITTTWIPEGSGVKVQCGLDSMAIKVPGHVQQVFPVDPRSGIYYLHHFTYALEGLYECIRLNMTTGKRVHLKINDCRKYKCSDKDICYAYRKGTTTYHACLKTVQNKLFKQSKSSYFFAPFWLLLFVLTCVAIAFEIKKQTKKSSQKEKDNHNHKKKLKKQTTKSKRGYDPIPSSEVEFVTDFSEDTPLAS